MMLVLGFHLCGFLNNLRINKMMTLCHHLYMGDDKYTVSENKGQSVSLPHNHSSGKPSS